VTAPDLHPAIGVLHHQPACEHDRVFVEVGSLARFLPTGRTRHVGDADVGRAGARPSDELLDALGDIARGFDGDGFLDSDRIMLRKNWSAHGSFIREDRAAALDMLGFASQLVFNTFNNNALQEAEHGDDLSLAYGMARAHNRAIVDFCSIDGRLLPVGYVPLADLDSAPRFAAEALAMGCKALMVASACPPGHSPTHVALDPLWAQASEARVPVVLHVGGGGRLIDPAFFANGLPPVPDFHGGDGNFRSIDYVAIQYPVMQFLAAFVIDGVLARFPDLRVGVIEQGATWLPGLMRTLDSAAEAFRKKRGAAAATRPATQRLSAAPGSGDAVSPRGRRLVHRAGRR
jgi:uncharacterized protein